MVIWVESQNGSIKLLFQVLVRCKDFEVELFTWEKLDYVEKIKEYFKKL